MRFPDSSRYEGEFMQARNNGYVVINHISTNRWEIRWGGGGGDGAEVVYIPHLPNSSVAVRMFIPDPDFYPSRIPGPGSKNNNKREGRKKLVVIPFFVALNFTELKIILFLKC
jgi:hypothetical protein